MRSIILILLILLSGLLLIGTFACDGSPGNTASDDQFQSQPPQMIRQSGLELMRLDPMDLRTARWVTVESVELPGVLETTGQIAFDDRKVATIISRVAGRIEEVRVSQWDYVRRGQPIATLFSPDIMTAEAEYLQSKTTAGTLANLNADGDEFGHSMVDAATRKLELLGIEPAEIAAIKTAAPSFVMRAPISGNIVQNQALRGNAVNPGDILYSLGTLEVVWVTADIYEDDMARVQAGQQLEVVTTAYPDEVFHGTIARVSPNVDPNTHTAQIRCEIGNPGFKLKPRMLARVKIIVRPGQALVVPLAALVFETDSYFVYVDAGNHLLQRRKVTIGAWNQEGYARITSGLTAGERIVARGSLQVNALWHQAHGENS